MTLTTVPTDTSTAPAGSPTISPFVVVSDETNGLPNGTLNGTSQNVINLANGYLQDAYGKSEDAYFLNLNTATENAYNAFDGQGLLCTDLLTFNNIPTVNTQSTPSLSTTPNLASVTLGDVAVTLTDTASLTDGYDPTGTITFTLVALAAGPWTRRRSRSTATGLHDADRLYAADDGHGDGHLPVGCELQRATRTTTRPATTVPRRAGGGEPGEPVDHDDAERDEVTLGTTSVTLNDTAFTHGRLLPDGDDHVHAVRRAAGPWTPRRSRSTVTGLHDADRLYAADDEHGDGHVPVGCQLQRRQQQQCGQRERCRRPSRWW